jgi:hypothetical protein
MEADEILKQITIFFVEDDSIVRLLALKFLKRRYKALSKFLRLKMARLVLNSIWNIYI